MREKAEKPEVCREQNTLSPYQGPSEVEDDDYGESIAQELERGGSHD
jgi:hypothetical protein